MSKTIRLGTIGGIPILARPVTLVGFLLLWLVLAGLGVLWLKFDLGTALVAGLIATLLHLVADLVHSLGHAWAAARTGYPMSAILFLGVLAATLYPKDEPALPGRIHVQRALGGPLASLILSVIAGLIALAARDLGGAVGWVTLFWFVENLFVFTLQVFIPLGFNDGSTLLKWWGK